MALPLLRGVHTQGGEIYQSVQEWGPFKGCFNRPEEDLGTFLQHRELGGV